jgi:hypothetical protein
MSHFISPRKQWARKDDEMVLVFIRGDFQVTNLRLLFGEGDMISVDPGYVQHKYDFSWESNQVQ